MSKPVPAIIALVCVMALVACSSEADVTQAQPEPGQNLTVEGSNEEGPIFLTFGGFLHIDSSGANLCSSLAESFPPQCGDALVRIVGSADDIIDAARSSFDNPDDAPITTENDVTWSTEWVTIPGLLEDDRLIVD